MAKQISKKPAAKKQKPKEEQVAESAGTESKTQKHDKALAELDALLDEIDAVLEENAEEFVNAYHQKGGQ